MRRMEPLPISDACCFKEGGNTFLRDGQDRVLIGIDHAALGFGSIAAHGHADLKFSDDDGWKDVVC